MKYILLLFSLLAFIICQPSYGFGLSAVNPMASTTTDYYFGISLIADPTNNIDIQSGASSTIILPSDYNNRQTNGAITCSLLSWGDPFAVTVPTPTCSISGTTITISNLFTQAYTLNYQFDLTIQISNIVNPLASGLTGNFFYYLYATTGTIIITATGVGISVASMSCSATTSPTTVNKNGLINLNFLTPEFTTSSTLQIDFSLYWPQANPQSTLIIPNTGAMVCTPGTNAGSSISCTFSQNGASTFSGTISNVVNSNVQATSIGIQFGDVITPPTTQPQGSILVIARSVSKTMSQCTTSVSGMTVGALTNPLFTPVSRIVNSLTDLSLQFTVNMNLVNTDTITVTFPIEISLSTLTQVFLPVSNQIVTPTINGQALNISGVVVSANSVLTLTFKQITNPPSELPTSIFQISTHRNTYAMDSLGSSLTYSASRTTIISAVMSASSLQIGTSSTYTLQFNLGQPLISGSAVVVSLPTVFQGKVGGCSPAPCVVTSNLVTFTSIATTSGTSITLTLTSVTNPLSIGTTTSLTLYTLYSSSQPTSIVQYTNSGLTVDLIARVMPSSNIAITSTSQVVSFSPASFTFTITNVNQLPANVYLRIYVPVEIGVSTIQTSCQVGSASVSCTYDSATRIITFSSISTTSIPAGALVSSPVIVTNMVNPSSTSPTSSFGIYLVNTLNQIVQYQATGLTFTSTQAATFFSLNLIPNNTINSALTSLLVTFTITATNYPNSSLLIITFPTEINIQLATCTPNSNNLVSVGCSVNTNRMQAILVYSSTLTATATQFTIATYKNYPSLQAYTMQVDLYADLFMNSKLNSNANSLANFQNTGVGAVTLTTNSFSNAFLSTSSNLNFQISSTDAYPFSYIVISFPAEFGTTAITCSLPSGVTCSINANSITITSTSTISLPLLGAINNLVTPSFSPSSNIYIQTFNSNNYLMDSNTQLYFQTSCTLPCKTCTSVSQPTLCTSCYTNTSLVSGQIYLNSSICVSVCGTGLYLDNITASCLSCVSPCATCSDAALCYTCINNYFFYNGSCLVVCPFGYYGFNGQCLVCATAIFCQSCPNSYSCSSCLTGYYFYNTQCYLSCPSDISYPNTVNRTCDACPTNCSNCQGNSSTVTCTTCNTGYVMDSNRCYLSCVTTGLIAVNGICQGCTLPCLTCSLLVTNCTSCDNTGISPYLYNFKCLSGCPNGFYTQNITFVCLPCTSPCQLCQNVSIHSCLSCLANTYLYLSDCLSSCPTNYYNTSGQCQNCVSPCLDCSDYSVCISCVNGTYLYQGQCLNQCPSGMLVVNGNQCLVCLSVCATCSSTSFCDSCFNGTYLYNGTCQGICPSGTFANTTSLVCDTCLSPCATCTSSTYCLTCLDSKQFQISGGCVPCTSPCNTCDLSITNCTTCITSTSTPYIFNYNCLSTCPTNYYSDNITFTCSLCVSPCVQCSGPTNSECITCITGYYLLLTQCLTVCPSGYFPNLTICSACVSPCQTCSTASVCLSCTNSTYLYGSSCVSSCGTGLTVFNNSICQFCSTSCQTCLSSNSAACTSCYAGAFLDQGTQTCSSSCTNGFYPDSSSGNGLCLTCLAPCQYCSLATYCLSCLDTALFLVNGSCLSCSSPCLTCSSLRTNCTSCDTNSSSAYLYSGTCNSACSFGFYPDASFQCIACSSPCASCSSGSSTSCLTCIASYYQLNSSCFAVCPTGYYPSVSTCSLCISPCQTCSDSSTCLSCITSYLLLGSNCVTNCSAGMAIINNTICEYCSSNCLTCQSSNSSSCTSCQTTTYLYSSQCLTICPTTTYQDNTTNVCQPCVNPCFTCQSATFCLTCLDTALFLQAGTCVGCTSPCVTCSGSSILCTSCNAATGFPYLYNSSCLASCPSGMYGETATSSCQPCTSPCQTCTTASTTSCLSCLTNYLLFSGSCLTTCPNSYYSTTLTCLACPSPCQNCLDNSTCTSCQTSLLLQGSQCVSNCRTGLTSINSTYCSYCSGTCLSCLSTNTSACTSCHNGLYLLGTVCYATCPSGYYGDSTTSTCLVCQSPCSTCNSLTVCLSCLDPTQFLVSSSCLGCLTPCLTCTTLRTNCTSCDTASTFKYLVNNNCLSVCPSGTYPSGFSCLSCSSPCDTCFNSSLSSCQTCIAGYILFNLTCISVCPNGYYSDTIQCQLCITPCATCSSSSICLSCISGQYLLGSQCYSSCPGGMVSSTVGNNSICEYCSTSCSTCLSANSSYCTSCPNNTFLELGLCLSNCSSGFFANTATSSCDLCVSPCSTCTSSTFCLSCQLSSDFLIGSVCTSCQSPCLTCSSSITTCSACNTSGIYPYFYSNNCLTTCPSTYYNNPSFICTLCQSPCSTCSGSGTLACLTCLTGYLQLNTTCYTSCPGGYYNLTNYCVSCTSPCLTCYGPGANACLACTSGLFLSGSSCVSNCSGMATNGSSCVFCASGCTTCQSTDNAYCTSCTNLYLLSGQCLTNCTSGYYPDTTLSQCMPCLSPCSSCTTQTLCLSCIDSTKFLINSTCVGCSSPCLTCSSSVTTCTSCDSLSGFPLLFQSSCVASCSSGYYQDTSTSCALCTSPCGTCTGIGSSSCLTCLANTYLLNTTCYSVCPTGFYPFVDQCQICSSPCSSCQTTLTTCTACITNYLLRGSSCVTNCSTGQVIVNNTYCQVCSNNCLTCLSTNYSYCTSCSTGTYLSLGTCILSCPNLTYPDTVNYQCLACVSPCVTCSSLTSCNSCLSSLFLVGSTCQSCISPCLTCTGTQTNCTTCNTSGTNPYLLLSGCLTACPTAYYDGGSFNCLACISPCSTCSAGTNRSCLTCDPGYSQLGTDCYTVCPSGYYTSNTNCLACNSSLCLSCTLSATTCISCISGLYLYGSQCVVSCPTSMTIINGTICQSCSSNCLTCLSSNISHCTSCLTNTYLYNGTCIPTCPSSFFADSSGSCLACTGLCATCQSLSSCLTCSNPLHYIQNFLCVSACTYPLIAVNGTCYACSSQCATCIQTVSTCKLCTSGFYYFTATFACELTCSYLVLPSNISTSGNNQCTQICPAGTYPNTATSFCVSCPTECSLCTNGTYCSQCSTGYSSYLSYCYNPCPTAAPYSINFQCIMCNIANCLTCLNTTYCQTCIDTFLLIASGNSSSCIVACPSGQQYDVNALACIVIPTVQPSTNIVSSQLPPYTLLMAAAAIIFIVFLVKFKYPSTDLALAVFILVNIVNSVAIIHLLYIEITNSGISNGSFDNISASTAVLLTAAGLQLASSLGTLIAIANIKDPEIVKVWNESPVAFIVVVLFSLVDSNFIFIITSQMFAVSIFQAKLTSQSMLKVMKFSLIASIGVKVLSLTYCSLQLLYYSSTAYRLLTTANYPIQNTATIQFLILTIVTLLLLAIITFKICTPEQKESTTKNQSHQSLMDDSNAFDKRNESNAQIMMSIDNSDMVVDLNSLKDQKQISDVEGNGMFFMDQKSDLSTSKRKRIKNKKMSPQEMLKQMDQKIEEGGESEEGEFDANANLFFMENQEEERGEDGDQIQKENELQEERVQKQQEMAEWEEQIDNNQSKKTQIIRQNNQNNQNNFNLDNNESKGEVLLIQENSIELFNTSNSKIADLSNINHKEPNPNERSNIFDSQIGGQPQDKHNTLILNFDNPDNNIEPDPKYSPSQISKYHPNKGIDNQFAQSYLDDAHKFNEHQFRANIPEGNAIAFEEVNNDFDQGNDDISFRKKGNFIEAERQVVKPGESREEKQKRQEEDIAKILEGDQEKYRVVGIEEEEEYRETPTETPINHHTFVEDLQEEGDMRPSQGLRGKRRLGRKKPDIPLPKNQTEKEIISIYAKKPPLKKDPKRRYDNTPEKGSKYGNYVQYSMEDQDFMEERKEAKPIFSGQISKNANSRYKRSIDMGDGSVIDEDMPVKPSLHMRKNSFKKIGEMVMQSQNSSRK